MHKMKLISFLLLLSILINACSRILSIQALNPMLYNETLRKKLRNWEGMSKIELIKKLGIPTKIELKNDGTEYLTYQKIWKKTHYGAESVSELAESVSELGLGTGGFSYTTGEKFLKKHFCEYIFGIKNGVVINTNGSAGGKKDCLHIKSRFSSVKRQDLSGIDLNGSDLHGSHLNNAQLNNANLSKVDLSGAFLIGANLSKANLRKAILFGANLEGANLSQANLDGADLYRANLSKAKLLSTNLSGANLTGAKLDGAILCHTKMPDGKENNSGCKK